MSRSGRDDRWERQWEWRWDPRRHNDWSLGSLILHFAGNVAGLFLADRWVTGVDIGDAPALLIGAAILTLVNAFLRPLLSFLTCLVQVLTLGLFTLILNALMLALTAWLAGQFDLEFDIDGFWAAVLGALLVSVVSLLVTGALRRLVREEGS